jgi:hypothetical protein
MAYETTSGIGSYNQYGARQTGGAIGIEQTSNNEFRLSVNLTGEMLNSGYFPPFSIPKGTRGMRAILRVDEVFVVSTSGTVAIGELAAPATNGIVLTEATLEALGTKDVTSMFAGTWDEAHATGTSAASKVAAAITGTVGATSGKGTLVIEFVSMTKV